MITNNSGSVNGGEGGGTFFSDNSSAAGATITNNGGTVNGADGGATVFEGASSADSATLIANGGMQGGTGMCPFLVGIGYFAGDDFLMVQYFIRDFDEEPSMLLAIEDLLKQFELVVTYNGAAFDIPLLETRFTLARLRV